MTLKVRRITQRSEIHAFVKLPFELYRNSEYWVPPMISIEARALDPVRNPAMAATASALFVAFDGRKPVGRIVAIAMTLNGEVQGRFGWFDVIDDQTVSEVLFEAACLWVSEHSGKDIRGPMGFTNFDKAGMLIEGFDELPTISTIYNWPYYNTHLEALGFRKSIDYVEHECMVPEVIPERVSRFADLIGKKYDLRVVADRTTVSKYGNQLIDLINHTHQDLYGFVPFSEPVKRYYINQYLPFLNPDFVPLVFNQENQLVGYALAMPSLSEVFQQSKGRLFPFGFLKISRALKHVRRTDLAMIGVDETFRKKGVTALLFNHLLKTLHRYEVQHVESNPQLENNHDLLTLWGDYPYRLHKRRRIYSKTL